MSSIKNILGFVKKHIIYILRVISRYYIAYNMFSYAFAKILKTQFNLGPTYADDLGLDSFNGFMLTWYYYGYSRTYGLVIASTQIVAGLLLLFRKTERLGVVLFLSFMVNILLVDIFYEIDGALWQAVKLTLLGFFLLFSDWKGFRLYFLRVMENIRLIPQILPHKFRKVYWLKFLIIPIMIWHAFNYIYDIKKNYILKNELFGIWRNVTDDKDHSHRLYKVTFDFNNELRIKDFSKNIYFGSIELDTVAKTIQLNANHYSEELRYFVQDSIAKLSEDQRKDKKIKKGIRNYYHTVNNSTPFQKDLYSYQIKQDTLLLTSSNQKELKFVNMYKE